MFIWDFVATTVLNEVLEWGYQQLVGLLGGFFAAMGGMGIELFQLSWVQAIIAFFSHLAWALYGTGLVVSAFSCGIEYTSGRANIKETALSALKGFLAVSLFTAVPVELYMLSVDLQRTMSQGISGAGGGIGELAGNIIESLSDAGTLEEAMLANIFGGFGTMTSPILLLFLVILMGYAVIKIFFSNLKRGGILLIQIAVGSLYMFSVPRGYTDGFFQWCKQVAGLCLTAFLQATILTAGLMAMTESALLGLGLMLSAGEVPRIAGIFGMDTSTRANIQSVVYTAQAAVNTTRAIAQAVA